MWPTSAVLKWVEEALRLTDDIEQDAADLDGLALEIDGFVVLVCRDEERPVVGHTPHLDGANVVDACKDHLAVVRMVLGTEDGAVDNKLCRS